MKTLLIKESFNFKKWFTITGESGEDLYKVEGKLLSSKVTVSDMNGREMATIEPKRLFSFDYVLNVVGEEPIVIRNKTGLTKVKFEVECQELEFVGNFSGCNYRILKQGDQIGEIRSRLRGGYEVDICQDNSELVVIATVVAVAYMNTVMAASIAGAAAGG